MLEPTELSNITDDTRVQAAADPYALPAEAMEANEDSIRTRVRDADGTERTFTVDDVRFNRIQNWAPPLTIGFDLTDPAVCVSRA